MKPNVGPREQLFRIAVGSAAVAGAALLPRLRGWRWLLCAWGLANITTALTRYCPSNQLTGIDNTRGRASAPHRRHGVICLRRAGSLAR